MTAKTAPPLLPFALPRDLPRATYDTRLAVADPRRPATPEQLAAGRLAEVRAKRGVEPLRVYYRERTIRVYELWFQLSESEDK